MITALLCAIFQNNSTFDTKERDKPVLFLFEFITMTS